MQLITLDSELRGVPNPEIAQIKEFRELIKRDRGSPGDSQGRKKALAVRELAYIYHLCYYDSPYANYDSELREEKIREDVFFDMPDWKPDEVTEKARLKFIELSMTESMRLLNAGVKAVQKLENYFDTIDLSLTDEHGKAVWSAKDLVANLSNLGKVVEGLKSLREQVEKEQSGVSVNRAGVKTNRFSE